MSMIKLPLLFAGSKGEKNLHTIFDSSANLSCINPDYMQITWKYQLSWGVCGT
jgi:hypothetical protein